MAPLAEPAHRALEQQASAWLAEGDAAGAGLDAADAAQALALAWALKAQCQAAWHRQPGLAGRTALGLQGLARQHPGQPELQGLSDWAQGLAALVAGDMARGLGLLQSGAACFDRLAQPAVATRLRVPCLMALSMLGRHDEALTLAGQLLDTLRDGHDELTRGKVALNRGSLLLRLDRYQEAGHSYRQAAVAFAHARDLAHSVMADIGLASTLTWQFEFDEAALMLSRARQRAQSHDLPVLEALALGEIGQLHLHQGALAAALSAFERACELLQGRAPPQRVLEAERARVEALLAARLLPETRQACGRLIEQALALQAPVEAAWARLMRAEAALLAGQGRSALQDLALARDEFVSQSNRIGAARADLLLARLHLQQGQADVAADAAQAATTAFLDAGLTRWRLEAQIAQARALASCGQAGQAGALLDQLATEAADAPQRAACEWARAELAASCGDWPRAEAAAQESARRHDALRRQVPRGELRIASQLDGQATHDLLVQLAARRQDGPALLQAMEAGRARSLQEALQEAQPTSLPDAPQETHPVDATPADLQPAEAAAEPSQLQAQQPSLRQLRQRLNWLQQQWQAAEAAGDHARVLALQGPLQQAEAQWLQQQRRAAADRPTASVPAQKGLEALTPAALQAALGPRRGLLMLHECGDTWHAVMLGAAGLQWAQGSLAPVRLAQRQLQAQLDGLRQCGGRPDRHAAQRLERTHQALASLHQHLLAPFAAALGKVDELVLLPHRSLHTLPWAALAGPDGPLVARLALVLAPSLSAWRQFEQRPALSPAPARALVLGVGGAQLPGVRDEARRVADLFGAGSRCLLDDQASLAAWAREAPAAELLHLACHASARADNPDFSAMHLHDGLLSLHEVAARPLQARLVVLSACDTLISQVAPGDELLGLARGFLLAGARAVLATLWSVPDRSTADCMLAFHQGLAQGLPPARALQQAQQQVARHWPHPFHWAPFVLLGAS